MQSVLDLLPERIKREIKRFIETNPEKEERINEIRLRKARKVSLTTDGENVILPIISGKDEIEFAVNNFCDGSVYAYSDTINKGYISLKNGFRVGICGKAVTDGGKISGVYDISSLNIRIPHDIKGLGGPIIEAMKAKNYYCGVLIYSPPGVGKTTLLKNMIYDLSKTKRVAVIDTRGELDVLYAYGLVDVLSGYGRGEGIEIATRTLSPEIIVCDEIGSDEAEAILRSQNSGVPLVATAHSGSFDELMKRKSIKTLYDAGIFDIYAGIKRKCGERDYVYDIRITGEDK